METILLILVATGAGLLLEPQWPGMLISRLTGKLCIIPEGLSYIGWCIAFVLWLIAYYYHP